jgi:hypothetical protein
MGGAFGKAEVAFRAAGLLVIAPSGLLLPARGVRNDQKGFLSD